MQRKEECARIAVMVWKGLMQSVQASPADALAGFFFLHSIRHQVFHGAGVHRFRFLQFGKGRFIGEGDCSHLFAISLIAIHWEVILEFLESNGKRIFWVLPVIMPQSKEPTQILRAPVISGRAELSDL